MKYILLFLSVYCFCVNGFSQTLPDSRAVDWTLVGNKEGFLVPTKVIDITNSGSSPIDLTSMDLAYSEILNAIDDEPVTIYFPNGTYTFTEPLHLKNNVVLQGESIDSTILLFDLKNEDHLIIAQGESLDDTAILLSDAHKEDQMIEVDNPGVFSKGDHIRLIENDDSLVTSTWAIHSTGQINKIDSINENFIFLDSPLRKDYSLANEAMLIKLNPVKNAGIENLTLKRLDPTESQKSNIYFEYAYNCRVSCIESSYCNFAHVELRKSSNIVVSGSYFHDAFDYGGGGKAYGVLLHFSTGECLITENTFDHLRHSMILQAGANGNVISYNYSINPFWTGVALPADAAGDLVLHGNYPYANLFEGNTVQNIVIDDSHGINGKFNTFFRNRAELYGIFMNFITPTNEQNFIGNEITNSGTFLGNYFLNGSGHFEYGNNQLNTIIPLGTNTLEETSLYMETNPEYYQDNDSWPPIGLPNDLKSHIIETEKLYHEGLFSKCRANLVSSSYDYTEIPEISLSPNPASEISILNIKHLNNVQLKEVQLLTANGVLISKSVVQKKIDLTNLSPGLYFVRILLSNEFIIVKKLLKI